MERFLLCIDSKKSRRQLEAWLSSDNCIVSLEPTQLGDSSFDVIFVDSRAFHRLRAHLHTVKTTTHPVVVPVLLVTSRREVAQITQYLGAEIDEIVETPLREQVVRTRVATLLQVRRISRDLHVVSAQSAHTEESLQESEERYRRLFENAGDAIATFSLDGRITSVNRGAELLLGWSREDIVGAHVSRVATPFSLAYVEERARRRLAGERLSPTFEAELVRKDGSVIPVEARTRTLRDREGKPIGFQGIYRDIQERKQVEAAFHKSHEELEKRVEERTAELAQANTLLRQEILERKRTEEELRRQTVFLDNLFESAPEAIALLDINDCILRVNSEFTRMFGYTAEEALTRPINDLILPDDLRSEGERLTYQVTHSEYVNIETVRRRKDGTRLHVSVLGAPISAAGGQIAVYAIYRDITERVHLQEQLVEQARLAALGRITGDIAHELGTPLNSVLGYAHLLGQMELPEKARNRLQIIESQVQRMIGIIQHYLSRTRGVRDKQPVNMNELVRETLVGLDPFFQERRVRVNTAMAESLPSLTADGASLQRVLSNLLANAVDAMPQGGLVSVATRMEISPESTQAGIGVAIQDTGSGIPPEALPKVFSLFFTTKPLGRGTGLGLAICQEIVKAHGGMITINSTVGEGTCVRIFLPVEGAT